MKIFVSAFLFLATIVGAFGAAAADAEKLEKARTAFALAMPPEIIGDMGARTGRQVADQIDAALKAKGKSLSQVQKDEITVRFGVAFNDMMIDLEPQILEIYAEELSERELDLLVEIYSDPEMGGVMRKFPTIMEKMMPVIQRRAMPLGVEVVQGLIRDGVLSDL